MEYPEVYKGNDPYVFISYSHMDSEIVIPLIAGLQQCGLRIWYDGGIELGEEWPDFIANALYNSNCMMYFISQNALDSKWCQREVNFANSKNKKIISVYIEDGVKRSLGMELQLDSHQAIEGFRRKSDELLLEALMKAELLRSCLIPGAEELIVNNESNDPVQDAEEQKKTDSPVMEMPSKISVEATDDAAVYFSQAECYYDRKDYKTAIYYFKKAAEKNHAAAQRYLGDCYMEGRGVESNPFEAVEWYCKAAEGEDAVSMCRLGDCFMNGTGVNGNVDKAMHYYQSAAVRGLAEAQKKYADFFLHNLSKANQSVEWYCRAAEQDYPDAQYCLGSCYEKGIGTSANEAEAMKWYRKAADLGNIDAMFKVGEGYYYGKCVDKHYGRARDWLERAAESGQMEAAYLLGDMLMSAGIDMAEDNLGAYMICEEGIDWLSKAYDSENRTVSNKAAYRLGMIYYSGRKYGEAEVIKCDMTKAFKYIRKAAETGYNIRVMYLCGEMYYSGQGTEQDYTEAFHWFSEAARNGYSDAWLSLAECYEKGHGVRKNWFKALYWRRLAPVFMEDIYPVEN